MRRKRGGGRERSDPRAWQQSRALTWSPVRGHLRADGVGPHDDILVVDPWVRLLVYHLPTQRAVSLHWHKRRPFPAALGSAAYLALSRSEWVD